MAVIVVGFANGLALFIASAALGGDALNDHGTDGRSFVASHGAHTGGRTSSRRRRCSSCSQ
jgi:hypothetical protein